MEVGVYWRLHSGGSSPKKMGKKHQGGSEGIKMARRENVEFEDPLLEKGRGLAREKGKGLKT